MTFKKKSAPPLPAFLLEILVCPITKKLLLYDPDHQELVCTDAGLSYPIRGGVPVLLIEEARIFDAEKAARFSLGLAR